MVSICKLQSFVKVAGTVLTASGRLQSALYNARVTRDAGLQVRASRSCDNKPADSDVGGSVCRGGIQVLPSLAGRPPTM